MNYIWLGILAFLSFFLYDINMILIRNRQLKICFLIGTVLLTVSTTAIILTSQKAAPLYQARTLCLGILAVICFGLLIYSLFFALPFKNTYVKQDKLCEVCNRGIYALCRHPGVLMFTGFYVFLALALKIRLLLAAAIIFSTLNVLYATFQDRITFMKSIANYDQYRKDTPFLIPNRKSVKNCIKFYKEMLTEGKEC